VNNFIEHLERSILKMRLLRDGQAVVVAVSGGSDSMVLLRVLHELAPRHGWKLAVAHLNHQLRGRASDADERLVRGTADKLGLRLVVKRANVRKYAKDHKLSIEMAARRLRQNFLAQTASAMKIPTIALAHHADDQLELFFLRLLRGAGGEGLGGMKWKNTSPGDHKTELIRPLLDLPKSALKDFATEKRVPSREDSSNRRLEFRRNRIRHELLPLLRRWYQPALDKTVLRTMDIITAEADFVAQAATNWLEHSQNIPASSRRQPAKSGRRPRSIFNSGFLLCFDRLPTAVQRRAVQLQLLNLGIEPGYDLVETLRLNPDLPIMVAVPSSAGPDGSRAKKIFGSQISVPPPRNGTPTQIWLDASGLIHWRRSSTATFESDAFEFNLTAGAGELMFGRTHIRWRADSSAKIRKLKKNTCLEYFDADKVGSRISLRHWRPGDRFQPIGLSKPVKLQDLFTNSKVPRHQRHGLTVATVSNGEIFWVENLRISERFKLTDGTMRCLQWRWRRL